jgi:hypothetical protein
LKIHGQVKSFPAPAFGVQERYDYSFQIVNEGSPAHQICSARVPALSTGFVPLEHSQDCILNEIFCLVRQETDP